MDIEKLASEDIQEFIHANSDADIAALSLQKWQYPEWPKNEILQQIKSLQKAKQKLTSWTTRKGIIFPIPNLIEQASSEFTANYKKEITAIGKIFADLTAGTGSDSIALSSNFLSGYCIEADKGNAYLLQHNLPLLSNTPLEVLHGLAEDLLPNLPRVDLIFIDPQRRTDTGKKGLFRLEKTSPNIIELLPLLKEKADYILIKTSPFMDITEGLRQLPGTYEVHVVEHDKQCKELLFLIDTQNEKEHITIYSTDIDQNNIYKTVYPPIPVTNIPLSVPLAYIYEPGPALMKSEIHTNYAIEHNLYKLAPSTHIYTSDAYLENYPGRCLKVIDILSAEKKTITKALQNGKANISVRNFPDTAESLRKKWKLKDGGENTLFACTITKLGHKVILCSRHQ
jgi:hypothetical protein